ncbi:unnamed protein product [Toxocara canis]|uniref:Calcium/calmodulin-dependent protein kinase n=1 Tax=Toxocara canis TaxID=6265 RepID=A0A183UP70_TOXCA|nr:unnamed protein product [Toxocara canis]
MSAKGAVSEDAEREEENNGKIDGVIEEKPTVLTRASSRSTSFSSRLSTVIRRSLRLGPKRSTTASLDLPTRPLKFSSERESDVGINSDGGQKYFTKYADVRIEQYTKPYGTLHELKRLIQLARHSSVCHIHFFSTGHLVEAVLCSSSLLVITIFLLYFS